MTTRVMFGVACAALVGCHQSGEKAVAAAPPNVPALLQSGDARVCGDPGVQMEVIRSLRKQAYRNIAHISNDDFSTWQKRGHRQAFKEVSRSGLNKEISEVTCSAQVLSTPISWKVRPSPSEPRGYVVEVPEDSSTEQLAEWLNVGIKNDLGVDKVSAEVMANISAPDSAKPSGSQR